MKKNKNFKSRLKKLSDEKKAGMLLDKRLAYGKFKGKTLQYIIEDDPFYINFCINNVKDFKLNNEAYEYYLEKYRELKELNNKIVDEMF